MSRAARISLALTLLFASACALPSPIASRDGGDLRDLPGTDRPRPDAGEEWDAAGGDDGADPADTLGEAGVDGVPDGSADALADQGPDAPPPDGGCPAVVTVGENADDMLRAVTLDTWVVEDMPDRANGNAELLRIESFDKKDMTGTRANVLLRFELAALAGCIATEASLELFVDNDTSGRANLHRVTEAWDESATWNQRVAGMPWRVAGCNADPCLALGTVGTLQPVATGLRTIALEPSVVQDWIDTPAQNHGLLIRIATDGDDATIASSESLEHPRPRLRLRLTSARR